jgi:endonuclease-3
MPVRDKWALIHTRLIEKYGHPEWRQHLAPVDELVNTILSQNTSDTNRDKAFLALKRRFPEWPMVIDAPEPAVREVIRPAGLANQKAPRIQEALRRIKGESGEISLDFLAELPLDDARNWLVNLNGVGPKTAAIVLLFAFNRPAFPVDTHVYRLSGRLGLIDEGVSVEKAHVVLGEIVAPDTYYAFHLNLIRHGREVCSARNPKCAVCPLQDLCDYFHFVVQPSEKLK